MIYNTAETDIRKWLSQTAFKEMYRASSILLLYTKRKQEVVFATYINFVLSIV